MFTFSLVTRSQKFNPIKKFYCSGKICHTNAGNLLKWRKNSISTTLAHFERWTADAGTPMHYHRPQRSIPSAEPCEVSV